MSEITSHLLKTNSPSLSPLLSIPSALSSSFSHLYSTSPTFRLLLRRLRIYIHEEAIDAYGKPISDKWTLHRLILELRGVLWMVLRDERAFYLSLLGLLVLYTVGGLVMYLELGDEKDYEGVVINVEMIKLQLEVLKLKRLYLELVKEI
jgi:hypothetical protein